MMGKIIFVLCILIPFSLNASADRFASLVQSARELDGEGQGKKAIKKYEEAWYLKNSDADKTPVLIELVRLHRDDKKKGLHWVGVTENWFASHPDEKEKFGPWLSTMKGYVTGNLDPSSSPAFMKTWAIDQKLPVLIKEKKFAEAWSLVKERDLSHANLRTQVIHDVLAAVVEKDKSRVQFCENSLKRHPSSQAWTIKTCSFLQGWKKNKNDPSLKKSLILQINEEEPESSYLSTALDEL